MYTASVQQLRSIKLPVPKSHTTTTTTTTTTTRNSSPTKQPKSDNREESSYHGYNIPKSESNNSDTISHVSNAKSNMSEVSYSGSGMSIIDPIEKNKSVTDKLRLVTNQIKKKKDLQQRRQLQTGERQLQQPHSYEPSDSQFCLSSTAPNPDIHQSSMLDPATQPAPKTSDIRLLLGLDDTYTKTQRSSNNNNQVSDYNNKKRNLVVETEKTMGRRS